MSTNVVLFAGFNSSGQAGLWLTDGTAAGTHELTGIGGAYSYGLFGGGNPPDITVLDGNALFNGFNASGYDGLWVTDGTAAGTHELTGISGAYSGGLDPSNMTVFNGQAFFGGFDATRGNGLWVTDGTAAGTHELTGISGASNVFLPSDFLVFKNQLLFGGFDTSENYGLWVTDGTAAGTHELATPDLRPQNEFFPFDPAQPLASASGGSNGTGELTVFHNEVLFITHSGLWVTDGTTAGTHELTSVTSDASFAPGMTVFKDEVLFDGLSRVANNVSGDDLWVTDGTAAGTHELTGITGADPNGLNPHGMTVLHNQVLFAGRDTSENYGLWVTDGSAAGTHELTGISGAADANFYLGLNPNNLTVFDNEVFFNGRDDTGNYGLWVTDGSAAGTHELTGISGTGIVGLNPQDLTVFSPSRTGSTQLASLVQSMASFGTDINSGSGSLASSQPDAPRTTDFLAGNTYNNHLS
jgi:ELWxxDGT repeat protein